VTGVGRGLILIADGNVDALQMYGEFFRYHGFNVVSVVTGRDALTLAPGADAVITESRLPGGLSGLDVVALLKADDLTNRIPVVVVSSYAWDADRERAERAGCDLFLSKPCLPSDLMTAVLWLMIRGTAPARHLVLETVGGPDEHADDLESEVHDDAELEVDDYPETAEDFDDADLDDSGADFDLDDDEAEL